MNLDFLNAEGLDESILNTHGLAFQKKYYNADGDALANGEYEAGDSETTDSDIDQYEDASVKETEDEENTDSEPSDEEGVPQEDLPRFRTLVKNKKLELKAQYGKAKIVLKKKCRKVRLPKLITERECKKVLRKEICINVPKLRLQDKNACIKVPKLQRGWRQKWREFKRAGGLAQLRLQARGLAPIPKPTVSAPITPTVSAPIAPTVSAPIAPAATAPTPTPDSKRVSDSSESASESASETSETKKILGMPTGVAIGLGIAVLGLGGFLIYKKMKS